MNLYCSVLFYVVACLYCNTADASIPGFCCLQTPNKRVPVNKLVRYMVQKAGVCPISAIRFITQKGHTLCRSPDLEWVKEYMKQMDEKKKKDKTTANPVASSTHKGKRRRNKSGRRSKGKGRKRQNKQ